MADDVDICVIAVDVNVVVAVFGSLVGWPALVVTAVVIVVVELVLGIELLVTVVVVAEVEKSRLLCTLDRRRRWCLCRSCGC